MGVNDATGAGAAARGGCVALAAGKEVLVGTKAIMAGGVGITKGMPVAPEEGAGPGRVKASSTTIRRTLPTSARPTKAIMANISVLFCLARAGVGAGGVTVGQETGA